MPDLETWTIDNSAIVQYTSDRVLSLGINLGAPGDRRDSKGVVWLEFPVVAGDSPNLGIELDGEYTTFQDHPATMPGAQMPWISASGVQGLSRLRVGLKMTNTVPVNAENSIANPSVEAEQATEPSPYRIKMIFGLPRSVERTARRFSITVNDNVDSIDIELDPSKGNEVMHTIDRVILGDALELKFKPIDGLPILSGIELTKLNE